MLFGLILFGLVLVLLTGIPVFAGLMLFSTALLVVVEGNLGGIGDLVFGKLDTYLLVSIPLFTLMAHFMIRGKVVDDLFGAAHTLLRHLPGGMGVATVAACTVFAAISGSSVATALTVGSAAIPLMIRYGYSPRVAYGVVGGGGCVGRAVDRGVRLPQFRLEGPVALGDRRIAQLRNAVSDSRRRGSARQRADQVADPEPDGRSRDAIRRIAARIPDGGDGADLCPRDVPRDDRDHPHHHARRAAGAGGAQDQSGLVRHPAHD